MRIVKCVWGGKNIWENPIVWNIQNMRNKMAENRIKMNQYVM